MLKHKSKTIIPWILGVFIVLCIVVLSIHNSGTSYADQEKLANTTDLSRVACYKRANEHYQSQWAAQCETEDRATPEQNYQKCLKLVQDKPIDLKGLGDNGDQTLSMTAEQCKVILTNDVYYSRCSLPKHIAEKLNKDWQTELASCDK